MRDFCLILAIILFLDSINLISSEPLKEREGESCHSMANTEVKLMPGWQKLEETVKAEYGEFKAVHVNWDQQPSYPAFVCAHGTRAKFQPIKDGECKNITNELRGRLMTEGIVATSVYSGFEASSQVTVMQSTQFGTGVTVGISASVSFASLSTSVAISTTITNTKSSSARKTASNAVISTVRIKPLIGHDCHVRLHMESCSFTSDGSVPVLGTGYVWFEFEKRAKGRRSVAYNLESVLTISERSVSIPLSVTIDTKAHGNFESDCVCIDSTCRALMDEKEFRENYVDSDALKNPQKAFPMTGKMIQAIGTPIREASSKITPVTLLRGEHVSRDVDLYANEEGASIFNSNDMGEEQDTDALENHRKLADTILNDPIRRVMEEDSDNDKKDKQMGKV